MLGEELRLAALPLDQERHPGVVILHDDLLHQRVADSRAPNMYSSRRSSSPAMVAAEIMPRSATTQTRPMPKR